MPYQRWSKSDSGTPISSTSSVIAIANTPSLNASVRAVDQRSLILDGSTAGVALLANPAPPCESLWGSNVRGGAFDEGIREPRLLDAGSGGGTADGGNRKRGGGDADAGARVRALFRDVDAGRSDHDRPAVGGALLHHGVPGDAQQALLHAGLERLFQPDRGRRPLPVRHRIAAWAGRRRGAVAGRLERRPGRYRDRRLVHQCELDRGCL